MSIRFMAAAVAALSLAATEAAQAQSASTSTTRSTSTTTTDGNTTRTVTRSTTVSGKAEVDGEKAGEALANFLIDRMDPEEARLRRLAEKATTEDAIGTWIVSDGGRDATGCQFEMGEKGGFLGLRTATPNGGCPNRLKQLAKWRVEQGVLVFYSSMGQELRRLRFVEGRFIAGHLEMAPQRAEPTAEAAEPANAPG